MSDFACGAFEDLRRLMFWHGSNCAVKLCQIVRLTIGKTSANGVASSFFNFFAGFSGVNNQNDILFVAFGPLLTGYGLVYFFFEQTVSFGHHYRDESNLRFKMSKHYAHQRDVLIRYFIPLFYVFMFIVYYAGVVSLVGPMYGY